MSLIRRQAPRLLLIAMLMQVILGLTQLPLLGLLVVISVPALSAGILEAFHVTASGGRAGPFLLFKPLTSAAHSGRLLALGALVFVAGILTISLVLSGSEELLDPDVLGRIEQGDMEALAQLDQGALKRLALAFAIGISVSGTLSYFTIPLLWFHNHRLLSALGVGLKALARNWRAFLVLALGLVVAAVPVAVISAVLFALAGSGGALSLIVMALMMILLVAFQLLLFGTQYCAFRDIFGTAGRGDTPGAADDGQLVA